MRPETLNSLIAPLSTASAGVQRATNGGVTFIRITPATGDVSKFIGANGKSFHALKTIVEYAAPEGEIYKLSVGDGIASEKQPPVPRRADWDPSPVKIAVAEYLRDIGEPVGVQSEPRGDGYLLIIAAAMPREVWDALSRWITVMALSTGGYAALEQFDVHAS